MVLGYEIPEDRDGRLGIGKWVEIFECYGREIAGDCFFKVVRMRIDGTPLHFDMEEVDTQGTRLKPHEGQVVQVNRAKEGIHFTLDLSA